MEEEKKKNGNINLYEGEDYKNNEENKENHEQVNDWFEGIFS